MDLFQNVVTNFKVVLYSDGQEPVLEASVSNLEIKTSSAEGVWAATGSLVSLQVMMHSVGQYILHIFFHISSNWESILTLNMKTNTYNSISHI